MKLEILTFNKTIYLFKQWAILNKGLINDFGFGPVYDFGTSRQMNYPAMWVDLQTDSPLLLENRVMQPTFSFNALFIDKINNEYNINQENGYQSDNRHHIMSDCYQLGQDFLMYIQNTLKPLGLSVQANITTSKVEDETPDKVCGWVFGFQLNVKHYNCGTEDTSLLGDFSNDFSNDFNN